MRVVFCVGDIRKPFSSMMLKLTVLSLSLLTLMSTSAVSPALGEISDYFCFAEESLIRLIPVIHAITIVPTIFFVGRLARVFSGKSLLIFGLLVFTLSGTAGGFVSNVYALLLTRIFMGFGLGLVIPFSTALISDFFEGDEKTRLMGLSSSLNMLGGMIALLVAGQLAFLSWRLPFLIYTFGIPVLIMTIRFLPNLTVNDTEGATIPTSPRGSILPIVLSMFIFNLIFFILTPTMAFYLRHNSLGDSRITGMVIASANIGGFLAGIFLPQTRKALGKYFIPTVLFSTGMGFFLLSKATLISVVFLGTVIIGFANRSIYPLFFLKVTENASPSESIRGTSLLSTMIYLGQFMAPLFQQFVGVAFKRPDIRFLYIFVALLSMAASLPFFANVLIKRNGMSGAAKKE